MDHATLENFVRSCSALGVSRDHAVLVYGKLVQLHEQPFRHYHTLYHVDAMLDHLNRLVPEYAEMAMAIWFHDAIYDPREKDNETRSAALFIECLGSRVAAVACVNIVRFILATDHTRQRSGNAREDLIRDIDLSILGAPRAVYLDYSEAIRNEYSHVPDVDFARGRSAILTGILDRRIFHSDFFEAQEDAARANLKEEIEFWRSRVR